MALSRARDYLRGMSHHHLAPVALWIAVWVSVLASLAGGGLAIFLAIWSSNPRPRGFDFAASARRIRTMSIKASDAYPNTALRP